MKTIAAILTLVAGFSLQAQADFNCAFKAQQAAQLVGQSNGLAGNLMESPYSKALQTVTVDKSQSFIIYANGSGASCVVDDILLSANSRPAEPMSIPECNIKIQRLAQAIAQLNGQVGNDTESRYSTTSEFAVTVDKSQTYTLRVSTDGSCNVEQVSLNH